MIPRCQRGGPSSILGWRTFCFETFRKVALQKLFSKYRTTGRASTFFHRLKIFQNQKTLLVGESNPGRPRDRRKCYQLHQPGTKDTTGFEPVTAGSAILCSTTELSIRQCIHYFFSQYITIVKCTVRCMQTKNKPKYFSRESNSGPTACEAVVITN